MSRRNGVVTTPRSNKLLLDYKISSAEPFMVYVASSQYYDAESDVWYRPIQKHQKLVYDFKHFYSQVVGWIWLKFCKALVTRYDLLYYQVFGIVLFIWIPPLYTHSLLLCYKDIWNSSKTALHAIDNKMITIKEAEK